MLEAGFKLNKLKMLTLPSLYILQTKNVFMSKRVPIRGRNVYGPVNDPGWATQNGDLCRGLHFPSLGGVRFTIVQNAQESTQRMVC